MELVEPIRDKRQIQGMRKYLKGQSCRDWLLTSKNSDRRALVIETAGREMGIVVDEVTEVSRLQDSAIEPPPMATGNGCIRGIGKEGNRLLILLDVDKLFGEEEMQELKKVG